MKSIFKIILALLLAVNLSFATDDHDNSWEKKTIPKKFLNKDCKKLAKKIWVESMVTYRGDTILNMYKEPILNALIYEPPIKDIECMKNIRYKTYDANNYSYDFDFKWINKNTLLVQFFDTNPENICELWLYEEKDGSVDVYKFTSKNLPD
ncbi:hypothetical protein [Campylobacter concisus]|uniref:hypothetical protein n=1 Tax=Campylobacter concisus TaxID=199 RepID=UPI0009FD970B|nr:hypothetical protein [Campylobacter concisus]ORI11199.1 hypothetical protein A3854_08810 [Campylobacter concisus]